MLNHNPICRTAVLTVAISIAMMLGAERLCLGNDGDLTVNLLPNQDVGVAFPPSMGLSPLYSPQGGVFNVTITLVAPSEYSIDASSDVPPAGDPSSIWTSSVTTGLVNSQTWLGIGVAGNDDWADVYFAGRLVPRVSGDTGGGTNPPFYASVADISIYVDALGAHIDEHWTPEVSNAEHVAETSENGGLYIPSPMITTGTSGFPLTLPMNSDYKTMIARVKPPQWVSATDADGNVGNLTFTLPPGVAIYDSSYNLVTQPVRVPPNGLQRNFYLLADQNFVSADCIIATFTWTVANATGSAQDYARIAPVTIKPEAFYLKTEDAINGNAVDDTYDPLINDNVGSVNPSLLTVKLLDSNGQLVNSLTLENGNIEVITGNKFKYTQTKVWSKTERFRYAICVNGIRICDTEDYVTSGFRYYINADGNMDDKSVTGPLLGGLALAGSIPLDGSQADTDIFGWFTPRVAGGDMVVMTAKDVSPNPTPHNSSADPFPASDRKAPDAGWVTIVPQIAVTAGTPLDSVEILQFVYDIKINDNGGPVRQTATAVRALSWKMANEDWFVQRVLNRAEGIYFTGGGQDRYRGVWGGTDVETRTQSRYAGGVVVGGTSAGTHILGGWDSYTSIETRTGKYQNIGPFSCLSKPNPADYATDDPATPDYIEPLRLDRTWNDTPVVQISEFVGNTFLNVASMAGILTDTHFAQRTRMGRLAVFLANINVKNGAEGVRARGLAVDEKTAVLLDMSGNARIAGMHNVYFVKASQMPVMNENLIASPLQMAGIQVRRVGNTMQTPFTYNTSWDFPRVPVLGTTYTISATIQNGQAVLVSDQQGGGIY